MKYRGYQVLADGTYSLYQVKAVGQGKIPNPLIGLYTSKHEAEDAIDGYLNSLKTGRKNAKTKGLSTD